MANKRIFSKQIVDSDAFLDMPQSSQLLYFHLSMRADDEGFVGNPKKIMRMIGTGEDDLKVLLAKRFILGFESGVVVIKHWLIHNSIRMDRFNPTAYQEEKKQLFIKDNRSYTLDQEQRDKLLATRWQPNGNQMEPQVKLSKVKLSKDKEEGSGRFTPPSLEEVQTYCKERENGINAQSFIDFYESKGWFIGKNKMKSWKAAVRTWEARNKPSGTTPRASSGKYGKYN